MDSTIAAALSNVTMMQFFLLVANLLGGLAVGWLWYLQKRGDARDAKCSTDNTALHMLILIEKQACMEAVHKLETEANHRLNLARVEAAQEMVGLATKFTEMYAETTRNFVSKDDFNRSMEALFKKLDRIEEKMDRKADK